MPPPARKLRVSFVGAFDLALRTLLLEVLEFEAAEPPQLVFAMVGPLDPFRVLRAARALGPSDVPIIAILSLADDQLARRAVLAGARSCWPLDTSLELLRAQIAEAVAPDGR